MQWKKVFNFIRVAVTILLIGYLIQKMDLKAVIMTLKVPKVEFILLAILAFFTFFLLLTLRWKLILATKNINFSFLNLLKTWLIAFFFSNILPTTIGGDFIRVIDTGSGKSKSFSVVLMDRMTGFIGLFLFMLVMVLIKFPENTVIFSLSIIGFLITFLITLGLISRRIYKLLNPLLPKIKIFNLGKYTLHVYDSLLEFKKNFSTIMLAVGISAGTQVVAALIWYFLFLSFQSSIDILTFMVCIPAITVITMLPISIGGLGLRETSFVELMSETGVSKEAAFLNSMLFLVLNTVFALVGGVLFLFRKRTSRL